MLKCLQCGGNRITTLMVKDVKLNRKTIVQKDTYGAMQRLIEEDLMLDP